MVNLTQEQMKNLWIVSMTEDPNSHSNGAAQSWGTWPCVEGYAYIDKDVHFDEYYKKEDENGKELKSAGHVDLIFDDCQCEGYEGTCKIVTSCTFSMEKYNAYRNSLPNPVPGIVQGKISEAESKPSEMMAEGITINSINLSQTFLALDGSESNDEVFRYDQFTQDEILKAYVSCHSGMKNYTLKLRNKRAVKLPAEAIYRLYIECETARRMQEAYSEVYIKFLSTHLNDDRSQEEVVEAFTYGETEMPEEYNTELEQLQEDIMAEMMELAETLGITE